MNGKYSYICMVMSYERLRLQALAELTRKTPFDMPASPADEQGNGGLEHVPETIGGFACQQRLLANGRADSFPVQD